MCLDLTCAYACSGGFADCNGDIGLGLGGDGCETNLGNNVDHCGVCGFGCRVGDDTSRVCRAGMCEYTCSPGFSDCNGDLAMNAGNYCETVTTEDASNCGICGRSCDGGSPVCESGTCTSWDFASTGADGTFMFPVDTDDMTLPGRTYHFNGDVVIPAGKTLRTSGRGVLEIYATGQILIHGTIDVSGGDGGGNALGRCGSGGETGTTIAGIAVSRTSGTLIVASGGTGTAGSTHSPLPGCGQGGRYGGGGGGARITGSNTHAGGGGGGYGGGGGGGGRNDGEPGIGGNGAGGAAGGEQNQPGNGGAGTGRYAGGRGVRVGGIGAGGGGGSISPSAAADLAVESTFQAGSGGGGSGPANSADAGGGGGGGGALRLASHTRIEVGPMGILRADGGAGGQGAATTLVTPLARCCGGGGSGGLIYLAAPAVTLLGTVSAVGGNGQRCTTFANGGNGGLGRIRISANASTCVAGGVTDPPASCTPGVVPEQGYFAEFPN